MIESDKNVTNRSIRDRHARAQRHVDMHIDDGEFVFLVGPSGSGKSTIIKLLTAELQADLRLDARQRLSARVASSVASIPYMRRTLGVIFQDFRLIENKTVYENVAFAMRVIGASAKEIKKRVPYVLELVGLENKSRRLPNELSGGEQQRVAIARALVNNPTHDHRRRAYRQPRPGAFVWRSCSCWSRSTRWARRSWSLRTRRNWWTASPSAWSPLTRAESISDGMDGYYSYEEHNNFGYLVGEGIRRRSSSTALCPLRQSASPWPAL